MSGCTSQVKEELLVEALTKRKTVTVNDKLILPYSHSEVGSQNLSASSVFSNTSSFFVFICLLSKIIIWALYNTLLK